MAGKPKWKRFEDLAVHIQRSLAAPDAKVEQDVRMVGKDSGVERQIDIVLKIRAAQYDLFVAIDCKDYKHKVDVKDVEAFIGLVNDVGANKGAMIAARGFTQAAKNRARRSGLDLYTLVDAQAHEWRTYVSLPTLVEDHSLERFNLTISSTAPGDVRIAPQDFRTMVLYRADGTPIGRILNLLARRWNEGMVPHKAGEHRGIPLTDEATHILTDGVLYPVDVKANVTVKETLYFGQWPLVAVQGFADELKGVLITKQIETTDISADIYKSWQRVESRDSLAGRPAITLGVSGHYDAGEMNAQAPPMA